MASSFANMDIKINADTALDTIKDQLIPYSAMAFEVKTAEGVVSGDTVQVPFITKGADATAYHKINNNYETDNGEAHSFKPITINKHYLKTAELTPAQWLRLSDDSLQKIWTELARGNASAMSKDMMALILAATYGAPCFTGVASTFDADDLVDCRRALVDATGQETGLIAVLGGTYYDGILKDAQVNGVGAFGTDGPARNALLPNTRGFDSIISSNIIPGNAENLVGFVTTGQGIVGAQVVETPALPDDVMFTTSTDPYTGFTLGFRAHQSRVTGNYFMSAECWGGFAAGNTASLKRLISVAP